GQDRQAVAEREGADLRGVDRLLHTDVVEGAEDSRVEIAGAAATWPTRPGSVETAVNSAVVGEGSWCNFGKESITTSTCLTAGEVSKRYKGRGHRFGGPGVADVADEGATHVTMFREGILRRRELETVWLHARPARLPRQSRCSYDVVP